MKTIFTFILMAIFSLTTFAQDKIYVHTATAGNSSGHITYIDHPDLNGDPNANIVYKHVWNPNGESGVSNDNIDGLWYNGSQWAIYNEDHSTPMIEGAQFFVYIGSDASDFLVHVSDASNEGTFGSYTTVIDDTELDGNPGPYAIMSHYWNPNQEYNNQNYAFYYDTALGKRGIFHETNTAPIPDGAAFKILKNGNGTITRLTHQASTTSGYSYIDNANLNGNPNATFVYEHYWGVNGAESNINNDNLMSVWYDDALGQWAFYNENNSDITEGLAIDIIVVEQEILGVNDNEVAENAITMFPNPAIDFVTIATQEEITNISIFNILGQEVLNIEGNSNSMQIDISNLTAGNYLAKIQVGNAVKTLKLIKN